MRGRTPRARLILEAHDPDVRPHVGEDRTIAIGPDREITLGRVRDCDVYVEFENQAAFHRTCQQGWGGRKNLSISFRDDGWCLQHLGHSGTIRVNGDPVRRQIVLSTGDRVEPAIGLVFRFESDHSNEEMASYRLLFNSIGRAASLRQLMELGPIDEVFAFIEIWERIERRFALAEIAAWGSPQDAAVEADRRLGQS